MKKAFPWDLFISEMVGTALLLVMGLSLVILTFGAESPVARILPSLGNRRLILGFVFGGIGALIAVSPVGKISGAHINPIVSFGFWAMGKIDGGRMLVYLMAQLVGAVLGTLPLLCWGEMGRSVAFGATVPGAGYSLMVVYMGEVVATFMMISLLTVFIAFRNLRPYTPLIFPFLYSFLSWAESPISGLSTNPARSFGPALVSGQWPAWWIYWIGPLTGTLLSVLIFSALAKRIQVAKLYYFDSEGDKLFRRVKNAPVPSKA